MSDVEKYSPFTRLEHKWSQAPCGVDKWNSSIDFGIGVGQEVSWPKMLKEK
tara:strand:- start:121 stop:273 length:153 start_codon:yes stop_codon:yes gene_type:complete